MTKVRAVIVAIVVRVVLVTLALVLQGPGVLRVPDSFSYLYLASNLLFARGFTDPYGSPELFRVPGFPLVLVPGLLSDFPVQMAVAFNILSSAIIVVVIYRLARRLLKSERAAGICAMVAAVEPTMLTWSLKVMPETLLTLCLLLFVEAALNAIETQKTRWIVTAASALCAAAYVKPIAYPLIGVIALASFILRKPRLSWIFIAACAVLIAPWHLRNYELTGYAGFSTLMDRAVYLSAGGSILAKREHRSYDQVHQQLLEDAKLRTRLDDPARFTRIRHEGISLLASDPFGYAVTHVKGMARTIFDPGAVEYFRLLGAYQTGGRAKMGQGLLAVARAYPVPFWSSIFLAIVLLPLVMLPLVAATRVPQDARPAFLLMAIVTAWLLFAGGGVPGYNRFRVPAVPFLILMSAFAKKEWT